jgi:hypothetical protein
VTQQRAVGDRALLPSGGDDGDGLTIAAALSGA